MISGVLIGSGSECLRGFEWKTIECKEDMSTDDERKENEWWDEELDAIKREVLLARRVYQGNKGKDTEVQCRTTYYEKRRVLKKEIRRKKKEARNKDMEELTEENSWDKIWEIVAKWGVKRGERTYKARDGRELCEGNEWVCKEVGRDRLPLSFKVALRF